MVPLEVDVTVNPLETQEKPALLLATVAAFPHLAEQMIGQVVGNPVGVFGLDPGEVCIDAGFFFQLTKGSNIRGFAFINAALRHLPGAWCVDALAGEDEALCVGQNDAHAGARGEITAHAPSLNATVRWAKTPVCITSVLRRYCVGAHAGVFGR